MLCGDWIFSNSSNAHGCKDREWLAEYTPFSSIATVDLLGSGAEMQIQGIGAIELPVRRNPNAKGARSRGTLRLTNVLHIPSLVCNIVGSPILEDHTVDCGGSKEGKSKGSILDPNGKMVAFFKPDNPFFAIRLMGPPVGPTVGPSPLATGQRDVPVLHWSGLSADTSSLRETILNLFHNVLNQWEQQLFFCGPAQVNNIT
ncbi:uncharacterized protein BCR38DRAFT_489022 [Pseudomassariella vexata]|uniref:Retrovirus-related Pol polyprotein from transposon TNT 1-94-like beta-barrel domain-containing protein n=1 Tax=Pseudomassariella vexata TaxID=1141098 RepID=A0A1Y2DJ92_9PEZI|nr:uncharacterized protein BCR38DRAFT_489022 [Pseudomassariella vexata]ORY59291.1 hypothetical protein BCR38DRAFT_489022 [Pseudomassariella vexata]